METEPRTNIVFNYFGQAQADPNIEYRYTNQPAIQLISVDGPENAPEQTQRNSVQQARLNRKQVEALDSIFGTSLDWKYRTYTIQALSSNNRNELLDLAPPTEIDRAALDKLSQAESLDNARTNVSNDRILLFNVIVALEWLPDQGYLRQLQWAFRRASDLLYDVTDGYMAFGQVVFGDYSLMDCADFQIKASNRILPRSWVGGLIDHNKYQPIRMGRGVWHERNQVSIAWEEPEGYRTIIHEWGHYALFLLDQYIEPQPFVPSKESHSAASGNAIIIVPKRRLTSISIMETLEGTSELVSHVRTSKKTRDVAWETIYKNYPWMRTPENTNSISLGPRQMPLPLPIFRTVGGVGSVPQYRAQLKPVVTGFQNFVNAAQGLPIPDSGLVGRCWVYVLQQSNTGHYTRMLAQGTLDARSIEEGFDLLGANPNDRVLLYIEPHVGQATTFQGTLQANPNSNTLEIVKWDSIPVNTDCIIDVLPFLPLQIQAVVSNAETIANQPPSATWISVRVRNGRRDADPAVWLFPNEQEPFRLERLSLQEATQLGMKAEVDWVGRPVQIPALDGHVLVELGDTIMISTFSQGGGPPSHTGIPSNPITAGSSDGTAMLFFNTKEIENSPESPPDYQYKKVVTSILHGVDLKNPAGGEQPRSSIYCVATNDQLPLHLDPTLVIYFDTPYQQESGDLGLYCLNEDKTWAWLDKRTSTAGRFLATPLATVTKEVNGERLQLELAAPALVAEHTVTKEVNGERLQLSKEPPEVQGPRVECFQLFGQPLKSAPR
jgi:hypothetical protein